MADDTCITNDTNNNETNTHVEPYYTAISNFTPYTQILFIDSVLETPDDPVSQYVNESTFALIYKYNTDRDSILEILNNFFCLSPKEYSWVSSKNFSRLPDWQDIANIYVYERRARYIYFT